MTSLSNKGAWEDLPDELIHKIAQSTYPFDLAELKCVNKRTRRVLANSCSKPRIVKKLPILFCDIINSLTKQKDAVWKFDKLVYYIEEITRKLQDNMRYSPGNLDVVCNLLTLLTYLQFHHLVYPQTLTRGVKTWVDLDLQLDKYASQSYKTQNVFDYRHIYYKYAKLLYVYVIYCFNGHLNKSFTQPLVDVIIQRYSYINFLNEIAISPITIDKIIEMTYNYVEKRETYNIDHMVYCRGPTPIIMHYAGYKLFLKCLSDEFRKLTNRYLSGHVPTIVYIGFNEYTLVTMRYHWQLYPFLSKWWHCINPECLTPYTIWHIIYIISIHDKSSIPDTKLYELEQNLHKQAKLTSEQVKQQIAAMPCDTEEIGEYEYNSNIRFM